MTRGRFNFIAFSDDHVFTTVVVVDLAAWRLLVHPHLHTPWPWAGTESLCIQVRELLAIVEDILNKHRGIVVHPLAIDAMYVQRKSFGDQEVTRISNS